MSKTTIKADHSIDSRVCCPNQVLKAKMGFKKIKVGQVLEIIASDFDVKQYMPLWADKMGHQFLETIECEGHYKVYIRRSHK
ncbi:MAG: sulfurtransferase TusA family protein [Candidatus Heimdallarchaeota archaeon]|nr:sulfurtransferase TusA family protein [Candidatus Heimdallarchaeota archaeon]